MSTPTTTRTTTQAIYRGETTFATLLDNANREGGSRMVSIGGSNITLPVERKFASLETIQLYVQKVCNLMDYAGDIPVRKRKGQTRAHCERSGTIAIPLDTWALRECVVLHEVAHSMAGANHSHNEVWRDTFTRLLERCMAPEAAFALRMCWSLEGIG